MTQVQIKVHLTDASKSKMKWKWKKGAAIDQASLGAPSASTSYGLCMYDSVQDTADLVTFTQIAPSGAWTDRSPKGWAYKDKVGSAGGITRIKLKSGAAGKTTAQVKGKGSMLPTPSTGDGRIFAQEPSVTVQLVNSDGQCWTSDFQFAKRNDVTQFSAKEP